MSTLAPHVYVGVVCFQMSHVVNYIVFYSAECCCGGRVQLKWSVWSYNSCLWYTVSVVHQYISDNGERESQYLLVYNEMSHVFDLVLQTC